MHHRKVQPVSETINSNGVGCYRGFFRDKHYWFMLLTMSLIFFLVMAVCCHVAGDTCPSKFFDAFGGSGAIALLILLGLVFTIEGGCSPTFRYLLNLKVSHSTRDYIDQLYKEAPRVTFHMSCYHYETRSYTVTVDDGDGNSHMETRTEEVKIVTHTASGSLTINHWVDCSDPSELSNLHATKITKLDLYKVFKFDQGYHSQKATFIALHNRDTHYDFTEHYLLDGFVSHVLALDDIAKRPFFLSWQWYILAQMTVLLALPYRMWLSSISGKVSHTVIKDIFTSSAREAPPSVFQKQALTTQLPSTACLTCPQLHGLFLIQTNQDGLRCTLCGTSCDANSDMYECCVCNFFACPRCYRQDRDVEVGVDVVNQEANAHIGVVNAESTGGDGEVYTATAVLVE